MKFSVLFSLLLPVVCAGVKAFVINDTIKESQKVHFVISTDSKNTVFPKIDSIGAYPILSTRSTKSTKVVNNKTFFINQKHYFFAPLQDMTIPSFSVIVDGKEFFTKPIKIKIFQPSQTKGQPYRFDLKVDKHSAFIGEQIRLQAIFSIKDTFKLEALDIDLKKIKDFTIKSNKLPWKGKKIGHFFVFTKTFYLYPQISGHLKVPSLMVYAKAINLKAAVMFFGNVEKIKAYSNSVDFNIKPLPQNVDLVGDFNLSVKTDKTSTNKKEPINLTISVEGYGNLDEISSFDLGLKANIYQDKPKIQFFEKDNKLYSKAIFKYAIVSEKSFSIPSLSITQFVPEKQILQNLTSLPIDITIIEQNSTLAPATLQTKTDTKNRPCKKGFDYLYLLVFVIGAIFGVILKEILKSKTINKKEDSFITKLKKTKTQKELLNLLLIFVDDKKIRPYILKLETKIKTDEFKKIKKDIIKFFLDAIHSK